MVPVLPENRRIVTYLNPQSGQSAFLFKDTVPMKPFMVSEEFKDGSVRIGNAWTTMGIPVKTNCEKEDLGKKDLGGIVNKGGTVAKVLDTAPNQTIPFHYTSSVDYGIVLQGEMELHMGDGTTVTVKQGDFITQQATVHSWTNKTDQWARCIFIQIDAERPLHNGKPIEGNLLE